MSRRARCRDGFEGLPQGAGRRRPRGGAQCHRLVFTRSGAIG